MITKISLYFEIRKLKQKAESGDLCAQYELGLKYYEKDQGVTTGDRSKDRDLAKSWLEKASKNSNTGYLVYKSNFKYDPYKPRKNNDYYKYFTDEKASKAQKDAKKLLETIKTEEASECESYLSQFSFSSENISQPPRITPATTATNLTISPTPRANIYCSDPLIYTTSNPSTTIRIEVPNSDQPVPRMPNHSNELAQNNFPSATSPNLSAQPSLQNHNIEFNTTSSGENLREAPSVRNSIVINNGPVQETTNPGREQTSLSDVKLERENSPTLSSPHLSFEENLQRCGVDPQMIFDLQNRMTNISWVVNEFQPYMNWISNCGNQFQQMQTQMKIINERIARDHKSSIEQRLIDENPKLVAYQTRLQRELNSFICCYFLAPAGLFKLEDNKKELAISMIEGLPILGHFLKIFTKGLSFLNKKKRIYDINNLRELFVSIPDIAEVCSIVAFRMTILKRESIQNQVEQEYSGIRQIQCFYNYVKEEIDKQWRDLATANSTGVRLSQVDKMAILDCAFILQQILSGKKKLQRDQNLSQNIVEIIDHVGNPSAYASVTTDEVKVTQEIINLDSTVTSISANSTERKVELEIHHQPHLLPIPSHQTNEVNMTQEIINLGSTATSILASTTERKVELEIHPQSNLLPIHSHQIEHVDSLEEQKARKEILDRLDSHEKELDRIKRNFTPEHDVTAGSNGVMDQLLAGIPLVQGNNNQIVRNQQETAEILTHQNNQIQQLTQELLKQKDVTNRMEQLLKVLITNQDQIERTISNKKSTDVLSYLPTFINRQSTGSVRTSRITNELNMISRQEAASYRVIEQNNERDDERRKLELEERSKKDIASKLI